MIGLGSGWGMLRALGLGDGGAVGLERNQPKGSSNNKAIADPDITISTKEITPASPMEKSSSAGLESSVWFGSEVLAVGDSVSAEGGFAPVLQVVGQGFV